MKIRTNELCAIFTVRQSTHASQHDKWTARSLGKLSPIVSSGVFDANGFQHEKWCVCLWRRKQLRPNDTLEDGSHTECRRGKDEYRQAHVANCAVSTRRNAAARMANITHLPWAPPLEVEEKEVEDTNPPWNARERTPIIKMES